MSDRAPKPACFSSREEIERLCIRNLLASKEERVFFKDRESRFLLVSEGWLAAEGRGMRLEDVVGKTDFDIFSLPHASEAFEDEQRVMATGQPMAAKVERETYEDRPDAWMSATKLPLYDEHGEIVGTFGIARDVTAQIEAEQALVRQALHDPVTGLPNRKALMDRLSQALVALERRSHRLALLFCDLDDFKGINDMLGHDIGDRVLLEVGRRLTGVARRIDTVARLGGDEFVVLCPELRADDDVRLIADRLVRAIRKPLRDKGAELTVTGSVGAVVVTDHKADPDDLLRRADVALYEAKRGGRNRAETYDPTRHRRRASSQGLVLELRRAIRRSELFVLYQPLFRLDDGVLTGTEALVRWRHPKRGVVMPAEFIPLAEQHGVIAEIDAYVLDEACRQLATWTRGRHGWRDFTMAVNVSGPQLQDPALADRVAATIRRHRVAPSRLCLEITETALLGELGDVNQTIEMLSALGVRLALDDFGTGYSTLAHLQRLRTDILKIDRSFIAQIGGEPRDREILAAVTAMAHALGMTAVGEGIENDQQLAELVALGCDEGQGYLIAPPLPAQDIAALRVTRARRRTSAVARKRAPARIARPALG